MNLTIEGTLQGGLRRLRLEYISLIAGLALAAATGLTILGWPTISNDALNDRSRALVAERAPWQPESYVYIVGSSADAELIRSALAEDYNSAASKRFEIIIVQTPEDERALAEGIYAGVDTGGRPRVQIVDLRP